MTNEALQDVIGSWFPNPEAAEESEVKEPETTEVSEGKQESPRITSYNVCYTKLLRHLPPGTTWVQSYASRPSTLKIPTKSSGGR